MVQPALLVGLLLAAVADAVTLTVSTTGGNASSPLLYGIMFEDINHSGDGGIHGQLLRNNGFQGNNPGLTAYGAIGRVTLSADAASPLSTAITKTLRVAVPAGTAGQVGFSNAGYLGVPVNADTYECYFWVKGDYGGAVALSLNGPSGTAYATGSVDVRSNASAFTYYEATFTSSQSYESNNTFRLTFDGARVAGSALNFGLVQLFPSTYHKRHNGLRNDVATYLEQVKPSFLRFPGGNNLEGTSPATRWNWRNTVGPVHLRPGRQGNWGYQNTDALGLMEYMQWCIDMKMEPLLAVWSGLALSGGGVVSGAALQPYVADVMAELEFLLGGAEDTTQGALRARLGRAEPYALGFVEVGNEDDLSGGCATYASRFSDMYAAIHARYPNLTLITSTSSAACLPRPLPAGVWTDTHHYVTPDAFVGLFGEWDHARRGPGAGVVVGEYASTKGNDGRATYWSTMQGSCAEAVYMIGMERNSDVVKMASFAPLFEHYDMAQWSPDLFGVNSTAGSITGSTSFWVQSMFSRHRGATILPVSSDARFGPLYWVASSSARLGGGGTTYFVKLANYGASAQPVTVKISSSPDTDADAVLTTLSGPPTTANYPGIVSIKPKTSAVAGNPGGGYSFSIPAWGVAVLAIN